MLSTISDAKKTPLASVGRRRVQGHSRAPSVGRAVGREGQLVHRGSSNDGGKSDTGGVPAVVRRHRGVQAQAGGRDRGGLSVDLDWRVALREKADRRLLRSPTLCRGKLSDWQKSPFC